MQIDNKKIKKTHLYINCALKNTIFCITNEKGQLYKQWSSKSLKKSRYYKSWTFLKIKFP